MSETHPGARLRTEPFLAFLADCPPGGDKVTFEGRHCKVLSRQRHTVGQAGNPGLGSRLSGCEGEEVWKAVLSPLP